MQKSWLDRFHSIGKNFTRFTRELVFRLLLKYRDETTTATIVLLIPSHPLSLPTMIENSIYAIRSKWIIEPIATIEQGNAYYRGPFLTWRGSCASQEEADKSAFEIPIRSCPRHELWRMLCPFACNVNEPRFLDLDLTFRPTSGSSSVDLWVSLSRSSNRSNSCVVGARMGGTEKS